MCLTGIPTSAILQFEEILMIFRRKITESFSDATLLYLFQRLDVIHSQKLNGYVGRLVEWLGSSINIVMRRDEFLLILTFLHQQSP